MPNLRQIATPLTIGSTLLVGVTGVLMFFHAETPLAKLAHEWVGLAFVAIILLHVLVNRRPFLGHLKRPWGRAATGVFAVLLGLSLLPINSAADSGGRPDFALLAAVADAPLSALAPVLDTTPATLADRLQAAGYVTAAEDSSIAALSGGDRHTQMAIIAALLAAPQG